MRLLFIYFYKTKGTFKEGTIIELSKKYSVKHNGKFKFKLTKRDSFQDDFYGDNIDIGAIIGENGTGKSVLINSLRDGSNDYSLAVYEKGDGEFFYEGDFEGEIYIYRAFKINWSTTTVHLSLIDFQYHYSKFCKNNIKPLDDTSFVYYSPIIDILEFKRKKLVDVSDKKLLADNTEFTLSESLLFMENRDIYYFFYMSDDDSKIKGVKLELNINFFNRIEKSIFVHSEEIFDVILSIAQSDREKGEQLLDNITSKKINKIVFEHTNRIIDILLEDFYISKIFVEKSQDEIILKRLKSDENMHQAIKQWIAKLDYYDDLKEGMFKMITSKIDNDFTQTTKEYNYMNLFDISDNYDLKFYMEEIKKKIVHRVPSKYDNEVVVSFLIITQLFDDFKNKLDKEDLNSDNILHAFIVYIIKYFLPKDLVKKISLEKKISNDIFLKMLQMNIVKFSDWIEYSEKFVKDNLNEYLIKILKNKDVTFSKKDLFIYAFIKKYAGMNSIHKIELFIILNILYTQDNNGLFETFEFPTRGGIPLLIKRLNQHFKPYPFFDEINNLKDTLEVKNGKLFFELIKHSLQPFNYKLDPPLSSGQRAMLFIFARIDNAIKNNIANKNIIILLDEADLKLHLEW